MPHDPGLGRKLDELTFPTENRSTRNDSVHAAHTYAFHAEVMIIPTEARRALVESFDRVLGELNPIGTPDACAAYEVVSRAIAAIERQGESAKAAPALVSTNDVLNERAGVAPTEMGWHEQQQAA